MTLHGYAQASSLDQDPAPQEGRLRAAGCQVVRAEKRSGAGREGRAELRLPLDVLRAGDTLVATRVDRLARSLKDLRDIVHELRAKGVALRCTEQPVDTGTAAGKAFLDVFAEFETALRRERQAEGTAATGARGVYEGRRPRIDPAGVRRPREAEGLGPAAIARRLEIGRASVYRLLGDGGRAGPAGRRRRRTGHPTRRLVIPAAVA